MVGTLVIQEEIQVFPKGLISRLYLDKRNTVKDRLSRIKIKAKLENKGNTLDWVPRILPSSNNLEILQLIKERVFK